ncbi:MAG TPA: DUF4337 domain-containing protein [Bryobacteraceae bacterium]|jgi:hypothetical protein|nr:DUF4337 domain-containing protein [Bryobacteraceae bacterium]
MSVHEEVEEHVHHAQDPFDKIVAGTMAIIAALLAVVAMAAQHYNTETVLNQQFASDQWSYYQAKDIRRYVAQTTHDSLTALKGDQALVSHYADESAKYRKQADAIQEKAREFEAERDKTGRLALHFHFGEVLLEIGIVFSSLAILTKRRVFFIGGIVSAAAGVIIAAAAHLF